MLLFRNLWLPTFPLNLISIEGAHDATLRDLTMECTAEAVVVANTIRHVGGFTTHAISITGSGCGTVGNDIHNVRSTAIRLEGGCGCMASNGRGGWMRSVTSPKRGGHGGGSGGRTSAQGRPEPWRIGVGRQ